MFCILIHQNLYVGGGGKNGPANSYPSINTNSPACNNHSISRYPA